MSAKILTSIAAVALITSTHLAAAQQPKKVHRIGYLASRDAATESTRSEGIRLALRELGYIEGQNIAFEYRYGEGKQDQYPKLAAELVRLKVDVIVTAGGDPLIQAARNATKTIPIVMAGGGADPVEAGYVGSLARPGGNVTGLTNLGRKLSGKRLELLKEAVPKVARVAVLYNPAAPSALELKEVQSAARALGLTIQPWEVRAADDFEKVFAAPNKERPDGLYVIGGGLMNAKDPVTVGVQQHRICRCWRAHVLRSGPPGQLPARRILRGPHPERSQARQSTDRATHEVRVGDQPEDGEGARPYDSAVGAVSGG